MSRIFLEFSAVQSQKAVSDYFTSKQILPFGFAEQLCRRVDRRDAVNGLYPAYRVQVTHKYTNKRPSTHIVVESVRSYVDNMALYSERFCVVYYFVRDENENITLLIICQIICECEVSLYSETLGVLYYAL